MVSTLVSRRTNASRMWLLSSKFKSLFVFDPLIDNVVKVSVWVHRPVCHPVVIRTKRDHVPQHVLAAFAAWVDAVFLSGVLPVASRYLAVGRRRGPSLCSHLPLGLRRLHAALSCVVMDFHWLSGAKDWDWHL